MLSVIILTSFFIASLIYYIFINRKTAKLPPGPKGFPLLGNLTQISKTPHVQFAKWAKEFGDIMCIKVFTTPMIIINDPKLLKEVFQDSNLTGRTIGNMFDLYEDGILHGLTFNEGESWKQLRRFSLRELHDFGFGKASMEHMIMDEVKEILEWMKSQEGKTIGNIKEKMSLGVVNSLWTIVSGQRYAHDDPRLLTLLRQGTESLDDMAQAGSLLFFAPWLKNILPQWSGYNTLRKLINKLLIFFGTAVDEHKATYSSDHQRDFIDVFLKEIKQTTDKNSAFYGETGEKQLVNTVSDLFMAGSDTTSSTLAWSFLYLASFPEAQKNLQKEIELITSNSRYCSLDDRPSMSFTEALLSEVLRFSSITPTGVGHRTLKDVKIRDYVIPKDTTVMGNQYYIHFNPEIWGDPENFRPERYLSKDEKTFERRHESLIPFSLGKRKCVGESLARNTLFLFITNIFQKFSIKLDPNEPCPGLEPTVGTILAPKNFKIIFEEVEDKLT